MQPCYLAVDIGASSGRHIIGTVENGKMILTEVHRFDNQLVNKNGHLCWDLEKLTEEVIKGIRKCGEEGYRPVSVGIDTWAVDFVLLDRNGDLIGDPVAYRDDRTNGIRNELEKQGILAFSDHYRETGIQYQKFNTVYQLTALQREHSEQLENADALLMIPDYLNYRLTGVMSSEYTNASTTALLDAGNNNWDVGLIEHLGLPRSIFQKVSMPGTVLGSFTKEIRNLTGLDATVILPATHDTGSAFLAVPALDENAAILSSGTWSLMGVENGSPITSDKSLQANFTNEGGYEGRYRYLKNIMGLWMIQSVRRELGQRGGILPSFPELIAAAEEAEQFKSTVDADDQRFLAPVSMIDEIALACKESNQQVPETIGETMQCIYNSLSLDYRNTLKTLESLTGKVYTSLNIVGGGSQDTYLNQRTADAAGIPVYAGPTEGTALGNLMVQFIADGRFTDIADARNAIRKSFQITEFTPKNTEEK